jgi:hypothetical protein
VTRPARLGSAAALAAALLLGACTGREPTGYGDEVKDNFVGACTEAGGEDDVCECTYEAVSNEIEFDRFKEIEESIEDGSNELPPEVSDLFAQCGVEGPLPAGSSTTSTTEG